MRVADERARVPFALVGVVLLVTSATFAATVGHRPDGGADVDVAEALDRGESTARSALTTATREAARNAALDPVVEPADTPAGEALRGESAFRDSLRIRAYLRAADALATTGTRVGDARVTASVPTVHDAGNLSRARERVVLNRTAPGRVRVTLRNVSVRVHRDGRVVASRHRDVTVTVATTALLLHDRTARYRQRLDRDATEGPGMGRRLTARLYAMAWARGYAFHSGAPITNVVANRHVEFAANGAMLAEQRAVFGHADPAGIEGLERGGERVALTDVVALTPFRGQQWIETVLGENPKGHLVDAATGRAYDEFEGPAVDSETSVGVNATADRAFDDLLDGRGTESIDTIRRRTYGARARLVTRVQQPIDGELPAPDPPDDGWELENTTTHRETAVTETLGPLPTAPEGMALHGTFARSVKVRVVETRRWAKGNQTTVRQFEARDVYLVGVGLGVDHAPAEGIPSNPIDHLHEQGGPIDGGNLAGVPATVADRLVADRGGRDAVAAAIVNGTYGDRTTTVRATRPVALDRWTYASVASLRDRLRNVTRTVERGRLATDENGARKLWLHVREHRDEFVGAPAEYRSVADKTRVAIRAAYIERVLARLDDRAEAVEESQSELDDAVSEADDVPSDHLDDVLAAREKVTEPETGAMLTGGPGGPVDVRVDGSPAYLPLAAVPANRTPAGVGAVHPLVARNQNLFTVPYGDVTDELFSAFLGGEAQVPFRTAARTLASVETEYEGTDSVDYKLAIADHRDEMGFNNRLVAVKVVGRLAPELALTDDETMTVVNESFNEYPTTASRSLAIANGSMARTVAANVAARSDTPSSARYRDEVGVRTRVTFRDVLSGVTVSRDSPKEPASKQRQLLKSEVKNAAANGIENYTEQLRKKHFDDGPTGIPSGLGVVPLPGYWYATVNVWTVDVRGRFGRFAVRAGSAGPTAVGGTLAYARDGGNVTLDVDADGDPELLGRSSRVSFETETTVVVVVPPGGQGVGDVNGDADERSAGWPTPGVPGEDDEVTPCIPWPYQGPCSTNSEQTSTG